MEQKKKALGRGLEQLFDSEVLDFNSFETNILSGIKLDGIKGTKIGKQFENNVGRELAPAVLDCFLFVAGASPRPTINNKHLQINEKMIE